MEHQQDETKPYPRYVRISQSIPRTNFPDTIEGIRAAVYDLFEPEYVGDRYIESESQPACIWGSGVFKVETSGTLTLVQSDWDSSD